MKILVVDDDMYNRQLIGFVLEEAGHTLCFAENGEVCIKVWRDETPDLILMDVMMPVMNGYDAAALIKDKAGQEHTPIVFLTALSEDDALVKCLEVGDDFLSKPINFVMLQAKIRAHSRTLALNRQVLNQNKELAYFRAKINAEYEMTQHIMKAALQTDKNVTEGIRVHCSAHSAFNGDLVLTYPKSNGGAYILIGDFTGHGLAASVGSVPASQAFRTMAERNLSIGDIARELNKILYRFLPQTMFFAATVIELNPNRSRAEIWCGGLPDTIILGADGKIRRTIQSAHMPIGIMENTEFESYCETISMEEGDRIFVYTDGITECPNKAGDMYGEERLLELLSSGQDDLFDAVIEAVHNFNDDPELQDDLSLVEILCSAMEEAPSESAGRTEKTADGAAADSPPSEANIIRQPLPAFNVEFNWTSEQLKEADPLLLVRQWLNRHSLIRANKEIVFMIISELFNNALEHGVLGMSSLMKDEEGGFDRYYKEREKLLSELDKGFVSLQAGLENNAKNELCLIVMDSGSGFHYSHADWQESNDSFGRGIPLIKALSSSLEFEDEGATIRLTIPLEQ